MNRPSVDNQNQVISALLEGARRSPPAWRIMVARQTSYSAYMDQNNTSANHLNFRRFVAWKTNLGLVSLYTISLWHSPSRLGGSNAVDDGARPRDGLIDAIRGLLDAAESKDDLIDRSRPVRTRR